MISLPSTHSGRYLGTKPRLRFLSFPLGVQVCLPGLVALGAAELTGVLGEDWPHWSFASDSRRDRIYPPTHTETVLT